MKPQRHQTPPKLIGHMVNGKNVGVNVIDWFSYLHTIERVLILQESTEHNSVHSSQNPSKAYAF